jgi:hypothetical protein
MLISQNDPIHHSFLGGNSTAADLTASKGARRLAADAVFSLLLRCYSVVLFAVIPSCMPTVRQVLCGEADIGG